MGEMGLENIITMVTKHVIDELERKGIRIVHSNAIPEQASTGSIQPWGNQNRIERIDMSKYKSPVLTENHILRLHELTGGISVPKGTVITPKAKQLLRQKNILIIIE